MNNQNGKQNANSRMFVYAGALLAVIALTSLILISVYHARSNKTHSDTSKATTCLQQMNQELLTVNRNILMIISKAGSQADLAASIDNSFSNIDYYQAEYEKVEGRSEREKYRYQQAATFINSYRAKFDAHSNDLDSITTTLYIQEIHPLQTTATEMLNATIDINSESSQERLRNNAILFRVIQAIMIALLLIGEAAIVLWARLSRRQNEVLMKREEEVAEIQSKLNVSRQKVSDIAVTNILTGLKNRYAMTDDIAAKLKQGQFNIALFNVDGFRYINETYGYEFGDVYLTLLADMLRNEFSQYAEIYNYTSNGFCLVFNESEGETTSFRVAQKVLEAFARSYTVSNIAIQLTATGCFAHCVPSEISDVNMHIAKMEAAMRDVKAQGGNKLIRV